MSISAKWPSFLFSHASGAPYIAKKINFGYFGYPASILEIGCHISIIMSFCLSTWPSSQMPQGHQFEFSLFLASVGAACNLILHIHLVINWQL